MFDAPVAHQLYPHEVCFRHHETGLVRHPANIELIAVEPGEPYRVLCIRRNDVVLRFPLSREDAAHLGRLLMTAGTAA